MSCHNEAAKNTKDSILVIVLDITTTYGYTLKPLPVKKNYLETRGLAWIDDKISPSCRNNFTPEFFMEAQFHAQVPTFLNKSFLPAVEPKG